jgi:hypothetical protein
MPRSGWDFVYALAGRPCGLDELVEQRRVILHAVLDAEFANPVIADDENSVEAMTGDVESPTATADEPAAENNAAASSSDVETSVEQAALARQAEEEPIAPKEESWQGNN